MEKQNFLDKSDFLKNFYIDYPNFNYLNFCDKNNLSLNEEETVKYIYDKNINLSSYAITIPDNDIELDRKLNKYFNINLGLCINKDINNLDFNNFHIKEINQIELNKFDNELNFLILDIYTLYNSINEMYKDNIILIVNDNINNSIYKLIKKYNIQYFIISSKNNLLEYLTEYKLILENKSFHDAFYEIYNHKKKYHNLENNEIKFDNLYEIEILLFVKADKKISLKINDKNYEFEIKPNILNKINLLIYDNKINYKLISQCSNFIIKYRLNNEKIEQMYLSVNFYKYKEEMTIHKTYNLKNYYDPNKPAFFYGIVKDEDIQAVLNHKSKKYIIWAGGDIDILYHMNKNTPYSKTRWEILKKIQNMDEVYYIPFSIYMINDMINLFYKYKYVPFFGCPNINDFVPQPLGDKIYYYTYPDYQKNIYGEKLVEQIIKKRPDFKFLKLTHNRTYLNNKEYCDNNNISTCEKSNELIQKYKECFVGLRLTNHDGIANSVLELGLLGIKSIYNDILCPTSLNYENIDDIINHIDNEMKNINKINYELIDKLKKHLELDNEVFHTKYYEKKKINIIMGSGDYPYFGGAATNIYALVKLLRKNKDLNVIGLFNNSIDLSENKLDPDKIGNIINIKEFNNLAKKKIIQKLMDYPDIIFTKKWIVGYHLEKMFPRAKIIYLLGSVVNSELKTDKLLLPYEDLFNKDLIPNCIKDITFNKKIIVNSELSKKILLNYNPNSQVNVIYTSFILNKSNDVEFINFENSSKNNWYKREYDFGFISSSCDRDIKNINLFIEICNNEKNKKKIIIGKNSNFYKDLENTSCLDLMDHDSLLNILQKIKLVIITSHCESLSNLMFEAINSGCNILINKNIGGNELINKLCIANDINEYLSKSKYLSEEKKNCVIEELNYNEKLLEYKILEYNN